MGLNAIVEHIGDATLYQGDCLSILPTLGKVDAVVTDPPYPDYHKEIYSYNDKVLFVLDRISVPQFVFWTAKQDFPLSYSAIHIWDKKVGCGSYYERIFERNGQSEYQVFRHYLINSIVAASYTGDEYTGHPSQKPISLILELVQKLKSYSILDPFMGSGTTGVACAKLGRKFIGIEIESKYFDIACKRIDDAYKQGDFFVERSRAIQEKIVL